MLACLRSAGGAARLRTLLGLLAALTANTAFGQGHDMSTMASTTALPHNIPDFCSNAGVTSVASGPWSSASTWSTNQVPAAGAVVNVATGHSVSYDLVSDAALKCVAVNGQLTFRTDISTRMKVGTFMVMAGGTLEIGTVAAPVPASITAEIVIANQAIDTVGDPEQFGTGFIGFGTITMHGAIKTPTFSRVTAEPRAGQTTLALEQAVGTAWRAGDRVILPDTRHLRWNERDSVTWRTAAPQWEEFTITAISTDRKVITVSPPLQFDHLGARNAAGVLQFLPHVGNLSRNVIVRSEVPIAPTGSAVQGHVIFTDRATVDIRYALFRDLGRTRAEATGPSNPIGRYPIHMHHLMGPVVTPANGYQYTLVGNAIDGGSTDHRRRWGIAIHNTHYGLVQDNVIYNYGGAALSTEDGSESFNVIDHNFAVRSRGTGGRLGDGNEGQGFWFHGPNNYVRNNVAANFDNDEPEGSYGYKYFMRMLGVVNMPTAKGQDMSLYVPRDANTLPLLEFNNNEVYGASQGGLTYWWVSSQDPVAAPNPLESVIKDFKVWHVYNVGIYHYPAARITFDNLKIFGGVDPSVSACCGRGFHGEDYAAKDIRIINSDIEGMNIGFRASTAGTGLQTIENSYLQNKFDVLLTTMYSANGPGWLPARKVIVSNSRLAGTTAISMDWSVTAQSNTTQLDQLLVYSYQNNTADNFRVYYIEQATQNIAGGTAPCTTQRAGIDGIVCAIAAAPNMTGVTPSPIGTGGGVTVTISGTNFVSGATVTIGGVAATGVTVVNATTLTAVAPARPAGAQNVVVTNPDGQSSTLTGGLTYVGCSYSLSPTSQTFSSAGGSGSVNVSVVAGCSWNATTGTSWVTINPGASGNGAGSVGYSVAANTVATARSGSITIGTQTLTINQNAAVQTCSYALSAASQQFSNLGGPGTFSLTTGTGCTWSASTGAAWITINSSTTGSGFTDVAFTVATNNGSSARSASVTIGGQAFMVTQLASVRACAYARGDSDCDTKSDLTVYRPSTGFWYVNRSSNGYLTYGAYQWGGSTDVPVPGDYDGDGKMDVAVYRPANGYWYILLSSTNYTLFFTDQWGATNDVPVAGDYDGDGRYDLGIYRPSTGFWYVKLSSSSYATFASVQLGNSTDQPVPADYDGDGLTDYGVYRPSTGMWMVRTSRSNTVSISQQWGAPTDIPVTGDYDGDGKADLALYRPSTGMWLILQSSSSYGTYLALQWGATTDIVVPGDYDGDGRTDLGVYRPSSGYWYALLSTTGYSNFMARQWGASSDMPLKP